LAVSASRIGQWCALAGGRVVGVAVLTDGGARLGIEAGWRGKGLEQALQDAVSQ